jgi:beta-1,2-mannobiose phosphorylase / 1,2-beta-oligomannan phosphorylase
MVQASSPDLKVVGVFNAAVIRHDGDVVLLLRVSETPKGIPSNEVAAAVYDPGSNLLEIKRWSRDAPDLDLSDPRSIDTEGKTWLTSISHLRVARSTDGIHFEVEPAPAMSAENEYESYGIEDPRITLIDDTYWINYTAVSPLGITTGLASTRDFKSFERHGLIFSPPNRDVTIFPEKIGGQYVALHRPMPEGLGKPAIWIATSPDMLSWGSHRYVAGARHASWDDEKIGGGAVPFRVNTGGVNGWLEVYHGVTEASTTYSLGALLLDADDPGKVIARSPEPILAPETPYEREGFFGGVVFTCGLIAEGDLVRIYYGAADGVMAVADLSLKEILAGLSEA